MATKRDFVINYGIQADKSVGGTNTLVVDHLNDRVGISMGPNSVGANLEVFGTTRLGGTGSAGRRVDIDADGVVTLAYGVNSNSSHLRLDNTAFGGTSANHGSSILWRFGTNASPTALNSGRISILKEQLWTSTSSTQDSYFTLDLATDGVLSEKLRVTSAGNVGINSTGPNYLVDVNGDVRITSSNRLRFGGTSNITSFFIQYNSTSNSLDFVVG